MKKEIDYMHFEYSEKDIMYLEELISGIDYTSKEVISFFELYQFGEKVNVKLFDNLEEFRIKCSEKNESRKIPSWVCGLSFYENNKCNIYTLCLEEYQKTKGHTNCSLKDLQYLIIHEFVHACHQKYTNNAKLPVWLSEGLATTISHQYDNKELSFNATLEQMIDGGTDYKNYHTMFSYVLENYGRKYILELLKNKKKLEKETQQLYEEVKYSIYN